VFVMIIIPIAAGALVALDMQAISEPLLAILADVAFFIPRMIAAALILGTAYFIGRWVRDWLQNILSALGIDSAAVGSGLVPDKVKASKAIGTIALTAIMLVSAVAAVEVLEIQSVEAMVTEVVSLGSRVIFGLVIIGVGILLARLLTSLMERSTGADGLLTTVIYWLVVGLFVAMGLEFMNIADQIVVIAFGAILGSAAVAAAIAFGIGGRATAHKMLERWTGGGDSGDSPPGF